MSGGVKKVQFGRLLAVQVSLSVAACVALGGCSKEASTQAPPPLTVHVTQVLKRDLPLPREFVGRTVGSVDADVRARVQGVVTSMLFDEGKEVAEGQVLYTIDPAPFVAKVAEAKAHLAEAETRLEQASADLARIKPLAAIDAVSKRDLDKAVATKGISEGAVQAARARVEAAEIELGYTKVAAPTSGTIGISKVKVGEVVGGTPTTAVLNTVSKLDPIHVQFTISEREYLYFARLARTERGEREKRALELVLADGSTFPGRGEVVKLDRGVDATSGAITVEAAFPNSDKFLRPGLFAKLKTEAEVRKDALLVPVKAIKEIQGTYQVFIVDQAGSVEQRGVEVGPLAGELRVIESGVREEESVAVDGIQRLRTGMVVSAKMVSSAE